MRFPAARATPPASTYAATAYRAMAIALVGTAVGTEAELLHSPTNGKLIVVLGGVPAVAWAALASAPEGSPATNAALLAVEQSSLAHGERVTGVSLTARAPTNALADTAVDFGSRYYTPWNGIAEDAVNGSSHCILGPLWSERLGSNELVAAQLSRVPAGGILRVRVVRAAAGGAVTHVEIGGEARVLVLGRAAIPQSLSQARVT